MYSKTKNSGTDKKKNRTYKRAYSSKEKRIKPWMVGMAVGLVALLLLLLLVPGFTEWLYGVLGIRQSEAEVASRVEGPVKVHVINVLQGDAALLEADGEFALMDAGPPEAQDMLIAYLYDVGVKELRYVFLTHPHADHYGGMAVVLQRYDVGQVVLPNMTKTDVLPTATTFSRLLRTIENENIPAVTAEQGDVYPLGSGEVRILQAGIEAGENHNLLSLVMMFEVGGFRVLNSGDAERANENILLEEGADMRTDVYLAAHHGSSTSNSAEFLAAAQPQVVVISLAADNAYGHPHREVQQTLGEMNLTVLRTDLNGSVVLAPGQNGEVIYDVYRQE